MPAQQILDRKIDAFLWELGFRERWGLWLECGATYLHIRSVDSERHRKPCVWADMVKFKFEGELGASGRKKLYFNFGGSTGHGPINHVFSGLSTPITSKSHRIAHRSEDWFLTDSCVRSDQVQTKLAPNHRGFSERHSLAPLILVGGQYCGSTWGRLASDLSYLHYSQ